MNERDYGGSMKHYQDQLARKGISKDMLDMDMYAGLTASELQGIVDSAVTPKEMMKKEAIKRMKMLKLLQQPIREFKNEGIINLSENGGMLYWLDDEQKQMVKDFEDRYGGLVFHVIHQFTNFGELFNLLFVSKYAEEWDMDIRNLGEGECLAYVVNATYHDCSEFGSIGVEPLSGGLIRTW